MKPNFKLTAALGLLLALPACTLQPPAARPRQPDMATTPEGILAQQGRRNAGVHDPSTIVQCKNQYWLFYTGRGLPSWHSTNLVDWERGPVIFPPANRPAWIRSAVPANRGDYWAPDIAKVGGQYRVYYAVSTFGKITSAIGVAQNPTLDPDDPNYKWTDLGIVIQSTPREDFNTIDPAFIQEGNGRQWLSFGSFWTGIKLIEINPKTGLRLAPDSPIYSLAYYSSIEASYIYPHAGKFYLFVNWGACCRGTNSTYNIRIGRSNKITGPYLDKDGVDLLLGGGTPFLATTGPFIGPGHPGIVKVNGQEWLSGHFYDGTTPRGASALFTRPIHWDAKGWPVADLNP